MTRIIQVKAMEILDSRGNPTIQVFVEIEGGGIATALVPSGASTGMWECVELRDGDPKRYTGKGVQKACAHVENILAEVVRGKSVLEQESIDRAMIEADGTKNKSRLGANSILGVSMAVARAGALVTKEPLYRYLQRLFSRKPSFLLPVPAMNIINGGMHADNSLDFQELMIRPIGAHSMAHAVQMGAEIFHVLRKQLKDKGLCTAVGDEGGFAPNCSSEKEALDYILQAIETAGYRPGVEVTLALDVAASSFYEGKAYVSQKDSKKRWNSQEWVSLLQSLARQYPMDSIEDGMAEEDWEGWQLLTNALKNKVQLVGDDLFVTNPKFLAKGIELGVADAILIKPNQIGSVTETIACIEYAQVHKYATMISHRSGETEDTFIADLAVAGGSGQIKTGSLCRSERVAKYNRLLQIEKELGSLARYGIS